MIKTNDLAELPSGLGSWHIVGCGVTALIGWTIPGVSGKPATGPCAVGEDRIFASYTSFQREVINGTEVAGNTIIFDPESWIYTPMVEKDNLVKYEVLAGQLARANGIGIIYTPRDTNRAELECGISGLRKVCHCNRITDAVSAVSCDSVQKGGTRGLGCHSSRQYLGTRVSRVRHRPGWEASLGEQNGGLLQERRGLDSGIPVEFSKMASSHRAWLCAERMSSHWCHVPSIYRHSRQIAIDLGDGCRAQFHVQLSILCST
jgi:hypothetical protein